MDIKSMLVKLAEEQAAKMQEEAISHLGSDEMAERLPVQLINELTYHSYLKIKNRFSLRRLLM